MHSAWRCCQYTCTGVWNKSTQVAIKTLRPDTMQPAEFLKEAAIMKQLHHPKLVALYAVCSQGEPILIVTELMNGGSLLTCLRSDRGRTVKWNKLIDIGAQVNCLCLSLSLSLSLSLFSVVLFTVFYQTHSRCIIAS